MAELAVISADSHMMEPANLWETRLDQKFRDDAKSARNAVTGKFFPGCAPPRASALPGCHRIRCRLNGRDAVAHA